MKAKLIKVAIAFLLLVPFRLTISVLLVKLFTTTATIGSKAIPANIVSASVLTSKICYDLAVGLVLVITLCKIFLTLSIKKYSNGEIKKNYRGEHERYEWHVAAIIFTVLGTVTFIGSDIYLTNELFWFFNK